jgi:two-component system response regulator HydG
MERFMEYHWPGNVRELKSAMEFAFVIAEKGLIDLDQLPPNIVEPKPAVGRLARVSGEIPISVSLQGGNGEKESLIEALRRCNGNQTQAASLLGINRVTVWNRMKKYRIDLKKELVL